MTTRLAAKTEDETIARYMGNLSSEDGSAIGEIKIKRAAENFRIMKHLAQELGSLKPTQELRYVTACALALDSVGQHFSKEKAAKSAAVSMKAFESFRSLAAKLLNVENSVSLKDVAIRMGMEECIPFAFDLLQTFKGRYGDLYEGVPEDQAIAVALHVTASKMKLKYPKKNLMEVSKLKTTGFNLLADQMWPLLSIDPNGKDKGDQEKRGTRSPTKKKAMPQKACTSKSAVCEQQICEKLEETEPHPPEGERTETYWQERRLSVLREAFAAVKHTSPAKYKDYVKKYKSELPSDFFT